NVAVDVHRGEPERQRRRGDEEVLGHLRGCDRTQLVLGEVVDVESRFPDAAADLRPIDPPAVEDMPAEGIEREQRLGVDQLRQLPPVDVDGGDRIEAAPVVGDLRAAHALHPHREVEGCGADGIAMVELETSLVEPHLQHAGLERNLESAPGEQQRPLRHRDQWALRAEHQPDADHQGSARYGKWSRNGLSLWSGLGGVFGVMGAASHSACWPSVSTLQALPPQPLFMSRKVERNRVATWSSGRRPNGHVPVVSMSIALTFGMNTSKVRRSGMSRCFGFQESSGMLSSW